MIRIIFLCFFYLLAATNASLPSRIKRFLTPTTYPVPTTFAVPTTMDKGLQMAQQQVLGTVLANSRPINCPVKREARSRRVNLDYKMMREIYLQEVGLWDRQMVAETLLEARENFIDLLKINHNKTAYKRKQDVIDELKRQQTDQTSTKDTKSSEKESKKNILDAWRRKTTLDSLWNIFHPSARKQSLVKNRNFRIKRTSDGTTRTTDYCQRRGALTDDGYMHMCTSCALTTALPRDIFPRYINEVGCDDRDCHCLAGHGKCQPRILIRKVLRKTDNGCRLIIHDGQHFITDNWELYDQPVQVGCECVLDKRSSLALYVTRT